MRVCPRPASLLQAPGPPPRPRPRPQPRPPQAPSPRGVPSPPHSAPRPSAPPAGSQVAPTSAGARPRLGHTPAPHVLAPIPPSRRLRRQTRTPPGAPFSVRRGGRGPWGAGVGDPAALGSGSPAAAAALAARGSRGPGAAARSSPAASESGRATARPPAFLKPLGRHLRGRGWAGGGGGPFQGGQGAPSVVPPRPQAPPRPLPQTINYQPPFCRERPGAGGRPRGAGGPDHFCMTIDGREGARQGGRTAAGSVFSPW